MGNFQFYDPVAKILFSGDLLLLKMQVSLSKILMPMCEGFSSALYVLK